MSRKRVVVIVALIVALALGLYAWLHRESGAAGTLVLYGDVDIREALPAFNDSGRITSIDVQEGSVVKRGQLLVQSESRQQLRAFIEAWHGSLAGARATRARWSLDVDPLDF